MNKYHLFPRTISQIASAFDKLEPEPPPDGCMVVKLINNMQASRFVLKEATKNNKLLLSTPYGLTNV